ncbi:hypothetical protein ACOSQ2_013518 [Xanthoceras sorbifolium]
MVIQPHHKNPIAIYNFKLPISTLQRVQIPSFLLGLLHYFVHSSWIFDYHFKAAWYPSVILVINFLLTASIMVNIGIALYLFIQELKASTMLFALWSVFDSLS